VAGNRFTVSTAALVSVGVDVWHATVSPFQRLPWLVSVLACGRQPFQRRTPGDRLGAHHVTITCCAPQRGWGRNTMTEVNGWRCTCDSAGLTSHAHTCTHAQTATTTNTTTTKRQPPPARSPTHPLPRLCHRLDPSSPTGRNYDCFLSAYSCAPYHHMLPLLLRRVLPVPAFLPAAVTAS